MGLRPMEVLLILIVVLLLFGTSRLPQLGNSLGSAIRNFKKGFQGEETPEAAQPQKASGTLASATETKEAGSGTTTSVTPKNG